MSDKELDNKIRLSQARRAAVINKVGAADGNRSRESLYGGKNEKMQADKYSGKFSKKVIRVSLARKAKDMATAPMEIKITDILIYGIALILAFFKDLLDLALLGSLPGIGTVITWCISMAIGLVLMFDGVGSAKRKVARRLTKKMLILIAGTMIEGFLFGLNFFPFEMVTVGIIYWVTLVERKGEKRIINENNEYD